MTDFTLTVLAVDDDDLTAELVERALRKLPGGRFRVVAAGDGAEALAILRGTHAQALSRPHIILLDLNMPRVNGFEFLAEVRADPALRDSVIFILTTSDNDTDRTRAYQDQVAGYMVKSSVGPQLRRVAALLGEYHGAVHLP